MSELELPIGTDVEAAQHWWKGIAHQEFTFELEGGWVMMSSSDAVPAKRRNSELRLRKRATRRCASTRPVEQEADVTARVYLCRDRDVTIRHALGPGSLVVMGFRKRWWLNRTPPLARLLKRDGNEVILVGISRFQPACIGSVNVESTL